MTTEQIKKKILSYGWEPWVKRPFFGFIISIFHKGNSEQAFNKIGLKSWRHDFLFSNGEWYQAKEVYQMLKIPVLKWLKNHSIQEVTGRLEKSHTEWKKEITKLTLEPNKATLIKFAKVIKILRAVTTYVWATHGLEHFFTPLLKTQTQKYVKSKTDAFIGNASFPKKHNSLEQMVAEYKKGVHPKILAKRYGWMRARDGFARPYNSKEIANIAKYALKQPAHQFPSIPKDLQNIFKNAQELVYLRTLRSDIYFELMYLARPLLKAVAKKFHIPFHKLKYYKTESLLSQKPEALPENSSFFTYGDKIFYFNKPLFAQTKQKKTAELKGNIAQHGKITGRAKIVMNVQEMKKVNKGDILITYMTSPNFLPAMKLAAAFVTDEGGLTCHAAIVAREMRKPCVIGTKIATKVFKDGDIIEVDANNGVIKKL